MSFERIVSVASRLFFLGAFVFLGIAVIEKIANAFDYTILQKYGATHVLELAVICLVFVIAMQLREMREDLKRRTPD